MAEITRRIGEVVRHTGMLTRDQLNSNPVIQAKIDLAYLVSDDCLALILKGQPQIQRQGKFDPNGLGVILTYSLMASADGTLNLSVITKKGIETKFHAQRISASEAQVDCPKNLPFDPKYLRPVFERAFPELLRKAATEAK